MELLLLTIAVLVVGLLIGIPVPFTFFAGTLLIVVAGGYDYTFLLPYYDYFLTLDGERDPRDV